MQDKKQQSTGINSFYSNTCNDFEYKKNCFSKLSIKMKKEKSEKPKRKTKKKNQSRKGLC